MLAEKSDRYLCWMKGHVFSGVYKKVWIDDTVREYQVCGRCNNIIKWAYSENILNGELNETR